MNNKVNINKLSSGIYIMEDSSLLAVFGGKIATVVESNGKCAFVGLNELKEKHDVDRKSTRLNSSHANISYAVFCLKKKKQISPMYPFLFFCTTNTLL